MQQYYGSFTDRYVIMFGALIKTNIFLTHPISRNNWTPINEIPETPLFHCTHLVRKLSQQHLSKILCCKWMKKSPRCRSTMISWRNVYSDASIKLNIIDI